MIYSKQFIKEATLAAIGIFFVVLAILVFTQGINMLGRAADGRVAIDAVAVCRKIAVINPLFLLGRHMRRKRFRLLCFRLLSAFIVD